MDATRTSSPLSRRPRTSLRKNVCETAGYRLSRYATRNLSAPSPESGGWDRFGNLPTVYEGLRGNQSHEPLAYRGNLGRVSSNGTASFCLDLSPALPHTLYLSGRASPQSNLTAVHNPADSVAQRWFHAMRRSAESVFIRNAKKTPWRLGNQFYVTVLVFLKYLKATLRGKKRPPFRH